MFKTKIIRMVAVVFAIAFMVVAVTGCKNNADGSDGEEHYSGIVGTWEKKLLLSGDSTPERIHSMPMEAFLQMLLVIAIISFGSQRI